MKNGPLNREVLVSLQAGIWGIGKKSLRHFLFIVKVRLTQEENP